AMSAIPIREIISSDMHRASFTARAIKKAQKASPKLEVTRDLRSWNRGNLQGASVSRVLPEMIRLVQHPDEKAPGGESLNTCRERFMGEFLEALGDVKDHAGVVLLVTHSSNQRAVLGWLKAGQHSDGRVDSETVGAKNQLH